jgi:predicted RNA binding protein YcfA (HicA-like mRNA interferase family)
MPKDFYDAIIRALKDGGFERVKGGKGSHEKWRNERLGLSVIVSRSKSRHTANAIMKEAGLDTRF